MRLFRSVISLASIWLALLSLSSSAMSAQEAPIKEKLDLSMREMIRLVHEKPAQFNALWTERKQQQEALISTTLTGSERATAMQNIQWQWAAGLINYPYFHQRETGQPVAIDWQAKRDAIKSIQFDDETNIEQDNFQRLIQAWMHDAAEQRVKQDPALSRGDNRWLRANFNALEAASNNRKVKAFFMNRMLAEHIDDNGAKNILPQIFVAESNGVDPAQIAKFRAAYEQELQAPKDHVAYTYQIVEDVDLQLHVFPAKDKAKRAPVFVWFHGGSWSTGHWSYCPVVCRALQNLGFVVVQVEYRTSQRFDGTPLNALADAERAIDWIIAHSEELHIQSDQLMVGGFSSGGALASQMAVLNHTKVKAAAYISGGFDPSKDSWYNSVVGPLRDTNQLSPLRMINRHSPPQILFHSKDDEMCPYQDAQDFARKLSDLNIPNRLISFEQGGHFFVFKNPLDRQRITSELTSFIEQLEW
ncbi:alpha/beta hydrolase [Undibacterium baiyunense]|uniref:Alpha/beta hydrolase n=1 Tax=Undibacterium baiyunense TaxID=2828731 RepID=A0A941DHH2_9BURK|nr:alpha/beta hydrolase [Undibacterium baiyunense]MBR7746337.1 alpha/beta hydrolase [Undibacterium baiyunense]